MQDSAIPAAEEVTANDLLLNSMCQFDLAYCFIVFAMGTGHGEAYPSSTAFSADRANPLAERIVANADIRHTLFRGVPDLDLAFAMRGVYERAIRESATQQFGSRWWSTPNAVDHFIASFDPGV